MNAPAPLNFWQFLTNIWEWVEDHTTRIIATSLGTVTVLVGTGVIPDRHMKYYAAAIAILTYWRGQAITNTVSAAKQIVGADKASALLNKAAPAPPT